MGFNDNDIWWKKKRKRKVFHEGVDFCLYQTKFKKRVFLKEGTIVPVLSRGVILGVFEDFLGKTVFFKLNICRQNKKKIYFLYGHLKTESYLKKGSLIDTGEKLGEIVSNKRVPPHLHISTFWNTSEEDPILVNWKDLLKIKSIKLLDPMTIIL